LRGDAVMERGARNVDLRLSAAVLCALVLGPSPARARTTIVPDAFPTLQAAVDHIAETHRYPEAETLLVRQGEYAEILEVRDGLIVRGVGTLPGAGPVARIAGLRTSTFADRPHQRFEGLHFTGPVVVGNFVSNYFQDCRFDADLTSQTLRDRPEFTTIEVRRCEVAGSTTLSAEETNVDSSVFHGPVWLHAEYDLIAWDNLIEQVRGTALTVFARDASILRNRIRGGTSGIFVRTHDAGDARLEDNRVEDCAGDGIVVDPQLHYSYLERNLVSRCAATGIRSRGVTVARGNRVLDCLGIGFLLENLDDGQVVEGNVAGRCGNHGIVLIRDTAGYGAPSSVQSNTAFGCSGAGIVLSDLIGGPVARNLACFNTGPGLSVVYHEPWARDFPPRGLLDLSCNDWFGNGGGAATGVEVSPSDLAIDPALCAGVNGDGSLRSDSRLLDATGCGRIGALGQGCEAPTVAFGFEMWPRVLTPHPRTRSVTAWLEPPVPFSVAAIDVGTVRVNDVPVAPGSEPVVGDEDRDGNPDLQLRFDRAALERTLATGERTVTLTGRIGGRLFAGSDEIRVVRHGGPPSSVPRGTPRVLSIQAPPTATGSLRVAFTLVDEAPARMDVLDVAGRVVTSHEVGGKGPGEHFLELGGNARLAQGIYFLRLTQGMGEARTRMVVVR
jgi:hypothetical protein